MFRVRYVPIITLVAQITPPIAAAGEPVARDDVVVPRILTDPEDQTGPASRPRVESPNLPLHRSELDRAQNQAHPQVRRARELFATWSNQTKLPPALVEPSESPHQLRVRAAAQATREYEQYYRLASALEKSRRDHAATVIDALEPATLAKHRLPSDPCDRVSWVARESRVASVSSPSPEAKTKKALALELGLVTTREQACNETAAELAYVAAELQRAFGALSDWPPFDTQWLGPVLRRRSKSIGRALLPRHDTPAESSSRSSNGPPLDLNGLTSEAEGANEAETRSPGHTPAIRKSPESRARMRFSGH